METKEQRAKDRATIEKAYSRLVTAHSELITAGVLIGDPVFVHLREAQNILLNKIEGFKANR